MTAVTPEFIMKAIGFMAAKHLFVAGEVGLFEALAVGPATIEELASRTGVPSRSIAIGAAAMVGLGPIYLPAGLSLSPVGACPRWRPGRLPCCWKANNSGRLPSSV